MIALTIPEVFDACGLLFGLEVEISLRFFAGPLSPDIAVEKLESSTTSRAGGMMKPPRRGLKTLRFLQIAI